MKSKVVVSPPSIMTAAPFIPSDASLSRNQMTCATFDGLKDPPCWMTLGLPTQEGLRIRCAVDLLAEEQRVDRAGADCVGPDSLPGMVHRH